MGEMSYIKPKIILLKDEQELNEKWVQNIIAEDPSIIGLGDLILKDVERYQPKAGRLDLLLQDQDSTKRFEVEIQLGQTDESHIIRTIEYWDIERKRYPQYEHCAVIIAEDITSRFLNVISLFSGAIPLVAIQMSAFKIGDNISLIFTKVLDQLVLGLVDEDEEIYETTDRAYWDKRATPSTVKLADELLGLIKSVDRELELKYNKFYIGLAKHDHPDNFIILKPKKKHIRFEPRITRNKDIDDRIEETGLELMDYRERSGRYRFRLTHNDIQKNADFLVDLIKNAYNTGKE